MKKNFIFIGALVVLCSIALAAPAGALSEKDWRKQADNVCRQSQTLLNEDASTVPVDSTGNPSAADFSAFMNDVVKPNYAQVIGSIKALPAPKAIKAQVKKMLSLLQKATDSISPDVTQASLTKLFAPATKVAKKLGLKVCGQ
ncbi:unannotated protein [freshwater metagenome]|uniref:Unannotated protein n=1 Tax=freshwater metagenome TaxID=449393 RepID=A0A6J7N6G0_9ZZZZ|nr:hypothetical protein [Actinomycetota bacterium]MSV95311.1 hypothetical protein [Actinomycetota bacterium]MSY44239.1 hypothetical protein [Actinomycetota bacterium]